MTLSKSSATSVVIFSLWRHDSCFGCPLRPLPLLGSRPSRNLLGGRIHSRVQRACGGWDLGVLLWQQRAVEPGLLPWYPLRLALAHTCRGLSSFFPFLLFFPSLIFFLQGSDLANALANGVFRFLFFVPLGIYNLFIPFVDALTMPISI